MSHSTEDYSVNRACHRPSNPDWAKYRREMVSLYVHERLTLDEVREYMQRQHGFHASPRQYQERFKQWRARKNITNAVRKEMSFKHDQGRLSVSPDEHRRLRRQIRSHPERQLGSSSTGNFDSHDLASTSNSTTVSHSGTSLQGVGSLVGLVGEKSLPIDPFDSPGLSTAAPALGDGLQGLRPWQSDISWPASPYRPSANHNSSVQVITGHIIPKAWSISPSPSRMPSANDNAESIFFSVKQFCTSYVSRSPGSMTDDDDDPATSMSNALVQRSTADLKDIIYLYKVGDFPRADTFLDAYCDRPFAFVIDESVDFLRQLITTLAPINTTRRPEIRCRLLDHLYRLTKDNLGEWHPFTVICKHLQLDEHSMETSIRALRVIQNSVLVWSRLMNFKIVLDVIVMMRREHDYDGALYKALRLVDTCRIVFGPDSFPERKTKLEVSHIYIAQGDHDAALHACFEVSNKHDDVLALRAMENLAEVHRLKGELQNSAILLEAVADLVVQKQGHSVATTHILDKMFEMLIKTGGPESLKRIETYQEKYKTYV